MVKNKFILGEEWLYYKLYGGVKTIDLLLTETLKPLLDTFIDKHLIDQWFFIRYIDPENHIRLRLHFADTKHIVEVIFSLKEALVPLLTNDSIYKVQLDTYHRELSRYGKDTIELAETLFYNDSECIASVLQLIVQDDLLLLFALKNTDDLLQIFNLSLEQKLTFVTTQMQYFKEEFAANKLTNKQLSKKYSERKQEIKQFLEDINSLPDYTPLIQLLQLKQDKDKPIYKQLQKQQTDNNSLLGSLIHMSINRTFRSKQRLYEMLHYDFLVRYYKTTIAKAKYLS